jgi:hypothetical protein
VEKIGSSRLKVFLGNLANSIEAPTFDGSTVDGNWATRSVGIVTGEDTVDGAAGIGSRLVGEATALRLAIICGDCLMAIGSNMLEATVECTAIGTRTSNHITFLTRFDHTVTAETED